MNNVVPLLRVLGEGHLFSGEDYACGLGCVGFGHGVVEIGGAGGSFEAVGQEEALEGQGSGPDGCEGLHVFGFEFEILATGFEYAGVGGLHQSVFCGHEGVRFLGAWEDFVAVLGGNNFCGGVLIEKRSSAFTEQELDTLFFELRAIEFGS